MPSEIVLPVISVRRGTPATRIVRLRLESVRFRFKAGQAAMIGRSDRPERVPYSIACAPEESEEGGYLEFLVKIEPSGRWGHLFDPIMRGQQVAVQGPFGSFVLPRGLDNRPLLFIAGGTGIAPIRSMIVHTLRSNHRAARRLLFSARTTDDFAYLTELNGLARRGQLALRLHVTRTAPARWRGERGRITPADLEPLIEPGRTLCIVCGPAAMVADIPAMLARLGVPPHHVKLEKWSS